MICRTTIRIDPTCGGAMSGHIETHSHAMRVADAALFRRVRWRPFSERAHRPNSADPMGMRMAAGGRAIMRRARNLAAAAKTDAEETLRNLSERTDGDRNRA